MLIPVGLASLAYCFLSIKKYQARKAYLSTKEKNFKDEYVNKRRQVDFVYDSFIFAFTLALLYINIFSLLIKETSLAQK